MENLLTHHRSIYRIKNTELFIAVAENFVREIRECTAEYKSLEKVPVYRSVKGIVFRMLNDHLFELLHNGSEVEYAISSLEFDTGSTRLTA
jgi:hypothetical protein